jgi:ABC-type branched-subunit amino acid transport system substrate-binding protein
MKRFLALYGSALILCSPLFAQNKARSEPAAALSVGVISPLSGKGSSLGTAIRNGIELNIPAFWLKP